MPHISLRFMAVYNWLISKCECNRLVDSCLRHLLSLESDESAANYSSVAINAEICFVVLIFLSVSLETEDLFDCKI